MSPVSLIYTSFVLATLVAVCFAANGVDVSMADCPSMTQEQWQCLANAGVSFAVIEAWDGGYDFNSQISTCVNNAIAGGISNIDIYAFLCSQCSGNTPVSSAIQTLVSNLSGIKYGYLWIDVEQCSGCWSSSEANFAFVQSAVQSAQNLGVNVGVYSSQGSWGQTVGDATGLSSVPLWYAHYDGNPSFSDWSSVSFGGWENPSVKQYDDSGYSSCNVNVDVDWAPDR